MTINNSVMVELMVPHSEAVRERVYGFYGDVGWNPYPDTEAPDFIYVRPLADIAIGPTVAYWLTKNPDKIAHFRQYDTSPYSTYGTGLRLPGEAPFDLVEVSLVVPDDNTVHTLYERGGHLLAQHTYLGPREHAGAQEFRFADPFNFSLRVTADPGYQLR